MNVVAIVQARCGATRLPDKVLKPLPYGSKTCVLENVVARVAKCVNVDKIVIATTTQARDARVVAIARRCHIAFFRGSTDDVVSRYYYAAKKYNADIVVRLTSDCPCLDARIIDAMVVAFKKKRVDYMSNTLERSFPHGLDVEIFTFAALEKTFYEAVDMRQREHVCPYMYHSGRFRTANFKAPAGVRYPDIRITLDTQADYVLLCAVYDALYVRNKNFNVYDIVKLFKKKPWLRLINKEVIHKKVFHDIGQEVQEALRVLDRQDLKAARDILRRSVVV